MPYIARIEVTNHFKLPDFAIDFAAKDAEVPFRHLLLTGPNGSGKTTILSKLAECVGRDLTGAMQHRRKVMTSFAGSIKSTLPHTDDAGKRDLEASLSAYQNILAEFSVEPIWAPDFPKRQEVLAAFLPAHRKLQVIKPSGVEKVGFTPAAPGQSLAGQFLKHLVNLEVQSRLAREEEPAAAAAISAWLDQLEQALAELFDIPGLKLKFVRQDYDIHFVEPSGAEYDFNQLAAGHASVLNILAEILLRVPDGALTTTEGAFATQAGVVIIDEIETHIHPSLQERLLPFLVRAFPKVQFIVATHSPIVICSVDNGWVWDLRSMQGVASDELRGTPYGDLMKIHFGIETDIDLESTKQLKRLKDLRASAKRSPAEEAELARLAFRLRKTSHALALEVWAQLERDRIASAGE